ncbi:MAG: signal peptidase II [Armatimonadetes bacterium]|nr:signal peptidase II [Armatimonadota bacterium]MDE2205335.1 signal peptidase II [Armatimonadota bacterium]
MQQENTPEEPPASESMAGQPVKQQVRAPHRALRARTFYGIAALVCGVDQGSKLWAMSHLYWGTPVPVVGYQFDLRLTRNTGGAWSMAPHANTLFIVFAFAAIAALITAYHRMREVDLLVGGAFALALGGAVGNVLDRVRLHFVIDFFEISAIHWPIFNVADSAITLSIVLLVLHFLMPERMRVVSSARTRREES